MKEITGGSRDASVVLESGEQLEASRGVVVATDGLSAKSLLGSALQDSPSAAAEAVSTCCLYFRYASCHQQECDILYFFYILLGLVL